MKKSSQILKKNSREVTAQSANAEKLAQHLAHCIDVKMGNDIIIFDLRELSPITDFFVIANGLSAIHNRTIAESLINDQRPEHVEGYEQGHWILIDYFDVIVHIFMKETRDFYGLERLWGDAPQITLLHD